MTIDQILAQLQFLDGSFPEDALREAVVHRDEMIPVLLDVLRDVIDDPESYADEDRMIHIYALYLLAQFREVQAYPLIVKIFSLPGEMPFDLTGDVPTDGLGTILASVSDGEIGGILSLIENEQANPFVRMSAMESLVILMACGRRTREDTIEDLRSLFQKLERKPSDVWEGLAWTCMDIWPGELMDDLRRVWEEGLIDPSILGWEDIEEAHDLLKDVCLQRTRESSTLVTDIAEEMEWWACFHEEEEEILLGENVRNTAVPFFGITPPIRRTGPKIGRNDPCPCGSGKKFKKCCAD